MKCVLDKEYNKCQYFDPDTETCNSENKCSMQKDEKPKPQPYERKPRWYEKYYEK